MSKIKSYKGLMADDTQETIPLSTNNGMIGYRIVKFQAMAADTAKLQQSVLKIYKVEQTTIDDDIDFSDNRLLGAIYFTKNDDTKYPIVQSTIFDNEVFNQDIYITHKDASTGEPLNYYIELEQMNLSLDEQTVATLKDIRNVGAE
jgi:phenolic acid decarboxylase